MREEIKFEMNCTDREMKDIVDVMLSDNFSKKDIIDQLDSVRRFHRIERDKGKILV